MGQASLATFYVVFAILTIFLNTEFIGTWNANAIYRTVSTALSAYPFHNPAHGGNDTSTRHIDQVQDPEQVYHWLKTSLKPVIFSEQEPMSSRSSWGNWSSWNHSVTPATVGSFNRMVLARFTFKRWAVVPTVGQFSSSTPNRLAGFTRAMSPFARSADEETTDLCRPGQNVSSDSCYTWQTEHAFDHAGGYVSFLDPMEGEQAYDALLDSMYEASAFDLRLGSFTVDFIVYNANIDMFVQFVLHFTFDFAGNIEMTQIARSFNLNVFNTDVLLYLVFYIIRIACVVMLVIFLLIEFRRMWDLGFFQHFRRQGAATDLVSITISLGVFLSYWVIEQMPPFSQFQFEDLQHPDTRAAAYVSLCEVASSLQDQGLLIALNLLVVSLRTVSLVSGLHSNLGLILQVLHVSLPNFVAFFGMFMMLQAGFVLMSFFAFGSGYLGMSDIGLCIYKSFAMLTGDMVFDDIYRVDEILGTIYFFFFYILFYLVLINIFVTLLMSGYDVVDYELQKRGLNEKEQNPITLIFEELKADVVGNILKYGATVIKYATICLDPIVVSIKACFFCSTPSFLTSGVRTKQRTAGAADVHDAQAQNSEVQHDPEQQLRRNLVGFTSMIVFMAVWITLMTLQGRGVDSFLASKATLQESALDVMFSRDDNLKSFDSIHTFADVKPWAEAAIVGLYNNPTCAEQTASGASWQSDADCNSANNSQQLINRISNWNIGFLNTTFVRLTVQPACFVATSSRWASGSPTLRRTPNVECWNSVCTDVFSHELCRTADGQILDTASLSMAVNLTSQLPETFKFQYDVPSKDLGPFRMLGGLAFSLGVTAAQCQEMLSLLDADRWFSENSASMVFDWISYNGNMDLFTHNVVGFSLMRTGVMIRSTESKTFPMNVDTGGGYFHLQTLVLMLFGIYAALLLYHIVEMCRTIHHEFKRSRYMQKPFSRFLADFLSHTWNVVDLLSLLISSATFVTFIVFVMNTFRAQYQFSVDDLAKYVVPNDAAQAFAMPQAVNPVRYLEDDWYFFNQFERVQGIYSIFLQFAALNSLFIAIKTIKIVNRFGKVSKFSQTLAKGRSRNMYFLIVIKLQMVGFALAMTVIFGTMVEGFSSPIATMGSLLYWVCGWADLDPLLQASPILAILFFVAFIVIFRFISTNMFLATQLNTFADLVGESDILAAKRAASAKTGIKEVRYGSKKELQDDLELERQGENQVFVKKILGTGPAVQKNVLLGDVVSKVNKQKMDWRTELTEDDYEHIERSLRPDKDGSLTIVFQDAPKKSFMQTLAQVCCRCVGVRKKVKPGRQSSAEFATTKTPAMRPTVRNFWRSHGAIAEVEKESLADGMQEEKDEEESVNSEGEDGEGLEDRQLFEDVPQERSRLAKTRVKKRLDGFLFSRWPEGKAPKEASALPSATQQLEGHDESLQLQEEDILQEGWDIDEMADIVKTMRITGQEVWLDCLLVALEEEVLEESPIVEVLRTNDLQDVSKDKLKGPARERLLKFYRRLDQVLKILENKSYRKYYQNLLAESVQRQQHFQQQNEVLHDYVCELEKEFADISDAIYNYRSKKELMLTKLAGLLDRGEYSHLASRRGRSSSKQ